MRNYHKSREELDIKSAFPVHLPPIRGFMNGDVKQCTNGECLIVFEYGEISPILCFKKNNNKKILRNSDRNFIFWRKYIQNLSTTPFSDYVFFTPRRETEGKRGGGSTTLLRFIGRYLWLLPLAFSGSFFTVVIRSVS